MAARKGVLHHKAKLTVVDVLYIRHLRAQGLSYFKICEAISWKVGDNAVSLICTGQTWGHV